MPSAGLQQQSSPEISLGDNPTVPDTPFLFLQQRGSGSISVNAYIQMLLILISILAVVASTILFAYGMYLSSSIESKKEMLAAEEGTFVSYSFEEMKKTSDRIKILDQLLKEYVSIRSPLKLLEDVVENEAYFDNFSLTREKKGGYIASFNVITTNYQSLIQQMEALKLAQYLKMVPQPKADKLLRDEKQNLVIKITTPVMVQGVLPDEIVFLSETRQAPESTLPGDAINQGQSSTTPQ